MAVTVEERVGGTVRRLATAMVMVRVQLVGEVTMDREAEVSDLLEREDRVLILVMLLEVEEVVGTGGGAGDWGSGGGGSGYVYTSSTASQYPSGCLLNSSYYLTNASTTGNNRSGNGYARITLVE